MDNYELAIGVLYNKKCDTYETIDAICEAGFKNVFLQWYDKENWSLNQEEQYKYVEKKGLNVIFAHLGYDNINDIWLSEEEYEKKECHNVERYKKDLDDLHNLGIKLVVMHLTSKFKAPPFCETGLNRIKEIVSYAETLGIKIAFENTKIKGYVEYVLSNIKNNNVGVCYDIGHDHAHFNDTYNFDLFKDRILAVHLHDNHGDDDEHLLPMDGNIDYENKINGLKENGYKGYTTLEVNYPKNYLNMDIKEFYKEAYKRGKLLQKMFLK